MDAVVFLISSNSSWAAAVKTLEAEHRSSLESQHPSARLMLTKVWSGFDMSWIHSVIALL